MRLMVLALGFLFVGINPADAGYDKPYIGETKVYKAKYEDTFVHLARDNNLGYVEIRAANPDADPWIPGEGRELILPLRHILPDAKRDGVVINLPEMRLYAFINGDGAPETFPLGVGREGLETPVGQTKVVRKTADPVWRPTKRMREEDPELPAVVEAGPENPLGSHALYLGWPQYAIHGTNKPFGIGRRVSSGCIRMYPEGIAKFYELIPVGTKVTVVNQPIKLAWIDDELYLEAHPDMAQAIQMEETGQVSRQKLTDADMQQIIKVAGDYKDRLHWAAIRTAIRDRRGFPVKIGRRPAALRDIPSALESQEEAVKDVNWEEEDRKAREVLEEIYEEDGSEKEASYEAPGKKRTLNP
ncbi:MAG: hypothetical protein DHS20C02_12510 [Micavibrio sp.]|nr:MAG: hypothetical protein DHS20C02_12510 [Micavibrio sp.]